MYMLSSRVSSLAVAVSCIVFLTATGPADANKTRNKSRGSVALTLPESKSEAPVLMLVSLKNQSIRVFSGNTLVAHSKVSTGKKGHTTPTGIFSILQKKRRHHSNIYSRAPMPFMQRLTWSGIALHESKSVPSHPASHGCVRLPRAFAKQLYRYTDLGAHVIITDEELSLRAISDANPFDPEHRQQGPTANNRDSASVHHISARSASYQYARNGSTAGTPMLLPENSATNAIGENYTLRSGLDAGKTRLNGGEIEIPVSDKPVRILITRRTGRELVRDIQTMLNELGFDAGETDGWMGPATGRAIVDFQKEHAQTPTGTVSVELAALLRQETGGSALANGHVYVRQAGKPLFDTSIVLNAPEKPLGTHFLSALPSRSNPDEVEWFGATLADTAVISPLTEITEVNVTGSRTRSIGATLGRIDMPDTLRERLAGLAVAGSSLVISDHGISRETLRGTDFVVLTNTPDPD